MATAVVAPLAERPGGLAVVAEADRPVLLSVLAALALAGAALLGSRRPDVRRAAGLTLTVGGILTVLASVAIPVVGDPFPALEHDVPEPSGSGRRLVVELTSPLFDPVWHIYVDQGSFPTTRRWPVATYADSAPGTDWPRGVLQAEWLAPDRIRLIDLDHAAHDIPLAESGRPLARVW
ncbi:hypothetical protein [Streptomyces bambusae]|uniref:Uncharacterized protein n=1 Tax=Streptomyces bambusae TaxID=1550616 RepID=A0ABS6Z3T3_9ACTN|nr:hypothetical protein [Streptomyces bambusae]MBW5482425.1 hypothetical protein [Streptomyces bambusae]